MKKPLQLKQVLAALLTIAALASGLTAQATVQTGIMMQGLARTVNNQTMCTFVIQSDWGGDQIPAQTGSSYTFSNARMIHGTVGVTLNGTLNFQQGTAMTDVITATSFTVTIESSSLWFYGATVQTKSGTNVTGCTVTTSSNHNTLTVTIPQGKTFGAVVLDYVSNPPMTNSNTTVTVPAGDYWVSNANHKPQPEPTVVYGGQTTLVKDTDYTLSWSNNSSAGTGTVTVTGIGNYAGSATGFFYIRWAIYYVHFDKNHDDATGTISDQVFIYNTAQALTDNTFSRTGYSFDGWSTTSNGAVTYTDGQSVNNLTAEDGQTVTLYAQWAPITYNISYDLAGGSVTTANPTTYNIETATFTLNNPTRTGYTFAGWTGSNGTTPQTTVTINQGSIGDRSYTANWAPITYNISYDLAGGSVATANPTTYSIETATFTLNNPTREHYTFAGWTGTDLDEPTMNVTIAQGSIGDRNYTATWDPIPYNLTYDLAGGSVTTANPTTYNIETATFTLNNPTRVLSTFAGWTGTGLEEPTMNVTIEQGSTGDRSYTATWSLIPVTYIDADGNQQTCSSYTIIESSENNVSLGTYGLDCWYVVSGNVNINGELSLSGFNSHLILCDGATLNINPTNNAEGLYGSSLIIYGQSVGNGTLTANAPLNGIYTTNSLTINGGIINATSPTSGGINAGLGNLTINRGSVTAHGHYLGMCGENVIINGGIVNATNGEGSDSYGIKANLDITLGYTELTDRITASSYKSDDGTISVKAGQALYDGTAAAYSGTLNSTQINAIAGKTLEPCFILTLPELVNATGVISQEDTTAYALAGAEITLAAAEGYEITDGTTSFTMPAQNVVSDVTVQVITYNISYDLAGGSVATANPNTYNIETEPFTLNNPTRVLSTFAGWTGTGLEEPTMNVTIEQGSTGDRSYTATWTLIPVTYIDADGNQRTCTDFTIIESSENNVSLGTNGQDCWFVVSGNVNINGQLSLYGDSHLILCDGATLNINNTNNNDGLHCNNLVIYGQSVGNGTLTASAPWNGIHTNNNLTINGGIISATSTTSTGLLAGDDLTINRGSVTAHGHYDGMRGQNVIINGGIVNATNGEGSNSYGIKANLDITLGYTELTDRITASSYNSYDGTISVKAGQALYDGTAAAYSGTLNSTQIDAIAGKTLEPCFILTLPELVNATGVISQEDTTAYALAGAEITLAAVEGYEITDGTTSFTMPAQNVVSDVTVQIITYNITYDLAGGSVATANPTTYNIETETFTLNNPTREGYTFAGWTGTDLDEPTMNVTIAQGSTGDRSYTATWSTDAYTIIYDLAGGSVTTANPTTYNIETATFTLNNPTRQGYTFAGWTGTDLDEPTMTVTIAQGSTGDRSYTATWSLPPVTYIGADGVEHTLYDYTLLEGSEEYIEYGDDYWEQAWYVVAHDVTYNDGFAFFGIANLILMDGATLTVTNVSENHSNVSSNILTIYVQSGGTGAIVGENTQIYSRGSMTILGGNITLSGYSHGLYSNSIMNIYGGQISIEAESECIYAENDVTINGGEVSATMTADGTAIYSEHVVINGGVVTTTNQQGYGIYGNNEVTINGGVVTTTNQQGYGIYGYYEVTINGGLVTANATEGAYGISVEYSYRTITLGWTNATDRITSDSYYGTVTVATGQAFVDEAGNYYLSTLTDSQVAAMSGQTLIPFTDFDMPFAITYETNGGTLPSGYPATYTFAETVTLPIPTKEDNFFWAWYDNAAFDGYPITEITAGTSLGDKTFYAQWYPEYTDVTYLDADGQPQTVRAKVLYGDNTGEYEYEGGVYTILAKSDYWVFYDLLRFTGDATLILPDEGELVIGVTKGATDEEYGLFVDGNLTIFGQEMGSGTLFLGSINAEGNVNIYGGRIRCWSVIASNDGNGTITLSWTSPYNYISSQYSGTVVLAKDFITDDYNAESPIIIPAGQVSDIATINGKSLYPYFETMDVSYIDENGATHTVNARVLYGGETTLDGGYYTYLGEGVYFRQTLSFDGNTTLIIPDDSYLYIDDWYNSGHIEGNGIAVDGNLSIYGQAGLDGHIDISATVSFYATGDVTVSNVDFSDRPYTTNGILCGGDILIAGGWFYSFGILNANDGNGTITLGYLTEGDAIQAYDYEGTVVIREGQTMQDWYDGIYSGTLTSEEVANIAGQDLVPYIEPITLTVEGYGESNGGWKLIASPLLGSISPTNVENMLANDYDLYYFDQTEALEWQNYEANSFDLESGKGYLYANNEDVTLTFNGVAYIGNGEVTLSKTTGTDWEGWNLVGNPFNETAYLADGRGFYTMNSDGSELMAVTSGSIEAMEGIFVIANNDSETLTFTTTEPANNGKSKLALNLSRGNSVIDRAIVRFNEGDLLPKFQLNRNSTKVYIPQDGKDYAIVNSETQGEIPVSFKAKENGSYTISVNTEGVEMGYLHLIDNLTGADIDLLSTQNIIAGEDPQSPMPSYTFTANTTDYASRFKLVFSANNEDGPSTGSGAFAYINNGEIIVTNASADAVLQVVDVTGRIVVSRQGDAMNRVSTSGMMAGVYVLRLINGNDVKTQKIVIE